MHTKVNRQKDEIFFTHLLSSGASASSFGVEVAKLAGIPLKVVSKAKLLLTEENQKKSPSKKGPLQYSPLPLEESFYKSDEQRKREAFSQKLIKRLRDISLDSTTPLEALQILSHFKKSSDNIKHDSLFPHRQD